LSIGPVGVGETDEDVLVVVIVELVLPELVVELVPVVVVVAFFFVYKLNLLPAPQYSNPFPKI